MKRHLPTLIFALLSSLAVIAQEGLAPDQNPNYAVSRDHYMGLADSLTALHGTTIQDTYKAIDWLADRAEARAQRRSFRQQLRLSRAQWFYDSYQPTYRTYWGRYRGNYWRGYSFTLSPWWRIWW